MIKNRSIMTKERYKIILKALKTAANSLKQPKETNSTRKMQKETQNSQEEKKDKKKP